MAEVLVNFANLFLRDLSRSAVHVPIQQALLIFGALQCIKLGLIVAFTLGLIGWIHQAGKITLLRSNDLSFEVISWSEKHRGPPDKARHPLSRMSWLRLIVVFASIGIRSEYLYRFHGSSCNFQWLLNSANSRAEKRKSKSTSRDLSVSEGDTADCHVIDYELESVQRHSSCRSAGNLQWLPGSANDSADQRMQNEYELSNGNCYSSQESQMELVSHRAASHHYFINLVNYNVDQQMKLAGHRAGSLHLVSKGDAKSIESLRGAAKDVVTTSSYYGGAAKDVVSQEKQPRMVLVAPRTHHEGRQRMALLPLGERPTMALYHFSAPRNLFFQLYSCRESTHLTLRMLRIVVFKQNQLIVTSANKTQLISMSAELIEGDMSTGQVNPNHSAFNSANQNEIGVGISVRASAIAPTMDLATASIKAADLVTVSTPSMEKYVTMSSFSAHGSVTIIMCKSDTQNQSIAILAENRQLISMSAAQSQLIVMSADQNQWIAISADGYNRLVPISAASTSHVITGASFIRSQNRFERKAPTVQSVAQRLLLHHFQIIAPESAPTSGSTISATEPSNSIKKNVGMLCFNAHAPTLIVVSNSQELIVVSVAAIIIDFQIPAFLHQKYTSFREGEYSTMPARRVDLSVDPCKARQHRKSAHPSRANQQGALLIKHTIVVESAAESNFSRTNAASIVVSSTPSSQRSSSQNSEGAIASSTFKRQIIADPPFTATAKSDFIDQANEGATSGSSNIISHHPATAASEVKPLLAVSVLWQASLFLAVTLATSSITKPLSFNVQEHLWFQVSQPIIIIMTCFCLQSSERCKQSLAATSNLAASIYPFLHMYIFRRIGRWESVWLPYIFTFIPIKLVSATSFIQRFKASYNIISTTNLQIWNFLQVSFPRECENTQYPRNFFRNFQNQIRPYLKLAFLADRFSNSTLRNKS